MPKGESRRRRQPTYSENPHGSSSAPSLHSHNHLPLFRCSDLAPDVQVQNKTKPRAPDHPLAAKHNQAGERHQVVGREGQLVTHLAPAGWRSLSAIEGARPREPRPRRRGMRQPINPLTVGSSSPSGLMQPYLLLCIFPSRRQRGVGK